LIYVLSDAAEADLRDIIRHTRVQWGAVQVRRYVAKLKAGMAKVAAGKGAFKEMDALYPMLRVAHCGHHYLFFTFNLYLFLFLIFYSCSDKTVFSKHY